MKFEEIKKELVFKENFEDKSFFLPLLNNIANLLNNNVKVYVLKDNEKTTAIFILLIIEKKLHLSFYAISPKYKNEEVNKIVIDFLEFVENNLKNEFEEIILGVDYYNDELLEKLVEKNYSIISYKLKKSLKEEF